jgi:DNA-binding CsgD family transcriptional regulator
MSDFFKPQELLQQILNYQNKYYSNDISKVVTISPNYINEFSKNENSIKLIFDHVNFKVLHISDNVETIGGYSMEDFDNSDMLFILSLFSLDHFNFMYVWLKWAFDRHHKYGDSLDLKQAMCGVKIKHKNGRMVRILIRHYTIETNEAGFPTLAAITLDDITHLMKSDCYWGRIECGIESRQMHHIISTDKQPMPHDILSDREKGVVQLLSEGKESKEIGKLLFISSHTVDNHRRNMINKLGVRDTTGLVQICRMTGIIL